MATAEAMWDAMNESVPKQLKAGEWHIPFGDRIPSVQHGVAGEIDIPDSERIKISTAMCARVSYTVIGEEKEISYEKLISLHDKLIVQVPLHASPTEHCAKAMNEGEMWYYGKQEGQGTRDLYANQGWCKNFRGWIQYRAMLPNENITRS